MTAPPDLSAPFPDLGHEGIRQAVLAAVTDLATATGGVDDAYFLTDLLFSLLDGALSSLTAANAAIADLTARVTALEPPPVQ